MRTLSTWLVLVTSFALFADSPSPRDTPPALAPEFSVGPLVAFDDGDGEALIVAGSRIATLGTAHAT